MVSQRQQQIVDILKESTGPVTGGDLAARLAVSRQIVVQDIAVLRARGEDIVATPQGYVLAERLVATAPRTILACRHNREQTEDELLTLVDFGLKVVDVVVEHPIYGDLRGILAIASREDVFHFVQRVRESGAGLLSALTNGVHLHTVEASRPEQIARASAALAAKGYLLTSSEETGKTCLGT